MDKLQAMLSKLPHYYKSDDPESNIYNIIKAFADEYELLMTEINRADAMIGIDTTADRDLEFRWGKLLGITKRPNETNNQYRIRLKNSVTTLSGGTRAAIQYAVATGLGVNHNEQLMNESVIVVDGWDYIGEFELPPEASEPGHIVIEIDLEGHTWNDELEEIVTEAYNSSKAAGIMVYIIVGGVSITYYIDLDKYFYYHLGSLYYSDLSKDPT